MRQGEGGEGGVGGGWKLLNRGINEHQRDKKAGFPLSFIRDLHLITSMDQKADEIQSLCIAAAPLQLCLPASTVVYRTTRLTWISCGGYWSGGYRASVRPPPHPPGSGVCAVGSPSIIHLPGCWLVLKASIKSKRSSRKPTVQVECGSRVGRSVFEGRGTRPRRRQKNPFGR